METCSFLRKKGSGNEVLSPDRVETAKHFNVSCGNQFDQQVENWVFQIFCSRHCAKKIAASTLQDHDGAEVPAK
jgi:hypothetical protein